MSASAPYLRVALGLVSYLLHGGGPSAQIAPPTLLRDLNTGPPTSIVRSFPENWTVFGDRLWFTAFAAGVGDELHVTDGTVAGTRLVADLTPGPEGAVTDLTVLGDRLFFAVRDRLWPGLWAIDQTPGAAPVRVLAIGEDVFDGAPTGLVRAGNHLFFVASDSVHGSELWVSDGSTAGTRLVTDLRPGAYASSPRDLAACGDRVLFRVETSAHGMEFWSSDGTAAGTELLVDSMPGTAAGTVMQIVPAELGGRRLLLTSGKLYVTDGTAAGTTLLQTDIFGGAFAPPAATLGGIWLFPARSPSQGFAGLWRSDGTPAGSWQIAYHGRPTLPIGILGGRLIFSSDRLYSTDGTAAGTTPLAGPQIERGARGTVLHGQLLFTAVQDNRGGLFATDGQSAWRLFDDLRLRPDLDVVFAGRAWFVNDDVGIAGPEPWVTDGTAAGTRMFTDLGRWPAGATASSDPRQVTRFGGSIAFLADTTGTDALWYSDGTAAGTTPGPQFPGTDPFFGWEDRLLGRSGALFTVTDDPAGTRSYHADRGAGPVLFAQTTARRTLPLLPAHRDGVAVLDGVDVILSDGTATHTRRLPIDPQTGAWSAQWAVSAGATLLVQARGQTGRLFRVEDSGVQAIVDTDPGLQPIAVADHFVLMTVVRSDGTDEGGSIELWVTDGSAVGTRRLDDLVPALRDTEPTPLCRVPGGLLFHARGTDITLWFTNGTAAGTIELPEIYGADQVVPEFGAALLGDRLLVAVTTPAFGSELKVLAPDGVHRLDLLPGPGSSRPRRAERVGAELWFVADVPPTGRSLWRTDGTAAGTRLVTALTDEPSFILLRNGRVWFDMQDAQHGRELWSVDPGAVTEIIGHACGAGFELPQIQADDPLLGQLWTVRGQGGAPGQPGFLVLGARSPQAQPIAGWCWTELDLNTAVVLGTIADSSRAWSWSVPLPSQPALRGVQVVLESWHAEPGGPAGLAASPALLAVLGSW